MHEVFRPGVGRVMTVVLAVLAAGATLVVLVVDDPIAAVEVLCWSALVVVSCWACFWRPGVEVADSGVTLINVTRSVRLPWPAIERIDTKWALTLYTAYGKYTAWAAPAPGARRVTMYARGERRSRHAPASGEGVRPGDLGFSESGAAAEVVREGWNALQEAGHLDDPQLEFDRPPVEWHLGTAALIAALVVAGVLVSSLS